jgi:hypothetical protein
MSQIGELLAVNVAHSAQVVSQFGSLQQLALVRSEAIIQTAVFQNAFSVAPTWESTPNVRQSLATAA